MNKLKSRLVNSVSAVAFALLAFSFALAASPAYADELEGVAPPSQTIAAKANAEVAKGDGVLCHSYADGAETCVTAVVNLQSAVEVDLPTSEANENEPPATDAISHTGVRFFDAIKVEITQSVTIAFAGEATDDREEYTGSIPERSAPEPTLGLDGEAEAPVNAN